MKKDAAQGSYLAVVFQACRASSDRLKSGRSHGFISNTKRVVRSRRGRAQLLILLELNSSANIGQAFIASSLLSQSFAECYLTFGLLKINNAFYLEKDVAHSNWGTPLKVADEILIFSCVHADRSYRARGFDLNIAHRTICVYSRSDYYRTNNFSS